MLQGISYIICHEGLCIRTVTSQALSYLTHRSGLVVPDMKGVLDRGFSSCAVLAFCHGLGILSCMQVYVLPKDRREVTELKVPWK